MAAAAKYEPGMPGRFRSAVGWAVVLATVLLPLKFGSVAVLPEVPGYFPPEGWMYLLTDWSPFAFAILSGLLLLTLLATEKRFPWNANTAGGVLLLLASLPGWIAPSGIRDYMASTSLHLAAAGAWWCTAGLLTERSVVWRQRLFAAVAAGTLLVGVSALRQYFFGFEEMRAFANEQAANGIRISEAVMAQIYDTRVRATFANNNMLANYLLLTGGVTLLLMVRWGGRFTPEKVSEKLFFVIALLLTLLPLFFTRSRGALAALGAAALVSAWLLPLQRKRKILLGAVTLVLLIAGAVVFQRGRGTLTIQSRLDYWRTSAQLIRERPLTGFGWGGFFLEHTRRKLLDSEETARDPHDVVFSFASQAGVPAALVVAAVLLWPLGSCWRRRKELDPLAAAAAFGLGAAFLHFLADVGWEVSALLALYGTLAAALLPPPASGEQGTPLKRRSCALLLMIIALVSLTGGVVMLRSETALARLHARLYPESRESLTLPPTTAEVSSLAAEFSFRRPWSAVGDEAAGDFMLAAGETVLAERYYLRAARLAPERYSMERRFFDLAIKRGDLPEAHRHWEKMRQLFPTSRKVPPEPVSAESPKPAASLPATPSK